MFMFLSHLTVPEEDHPELERHFREPREMMSRTQVRHEACEVLMDSRVAAEWIATR